MRTRIPLIAVCAAAALTMAAWAQPTRPADTFVEEVDVNVINLTVNVVDDDGLPVTGLQRDDFEVVVDGEPVEISNFFGVESSLDLDEVARRERSQRVSARSDSPAAPTPPPEETRYVAIFIDNANIHNKNRRRVFQGLRDYLAEQKDPGTFYMVVQFRTRYEVVQPFTNSMGHVVAALDKVEKEATDGPSHEADQRMIVRDLASVDLAPVTSLGTSGMTVEGKMQYLLQRIRTLAEQTR
ncbi:MAG: VWA domain-containing protein, partial [Thermoanaerobaculia bacterium]|nr:VWA domain-containing protein [Thermoanaerobaculia bacterium]